MRSLTKSEQETTIRWDAAEHVAHIDTAYPPMMAKLDKLVDAYPDTYKCVRVDDLYPAKSYTVPAAFIGFRKPIDASTREAARQRARERGFGTKRG